MHEQQLPWGSQQLQALYLKNELGENMVAAVVKTVKEQYSPDDLQLLKQLLPLHQKLQGLQGATMQQHQEGLQPQDQELALHLETGGASAGLSQCLGKQELSGLLEKTTHHQDGLVVHEEASITIRDKSHKTSCVQGLDQFEVKNESLASFSEPDGQTSWLPKNLRVEDYDH